MNLGELLRSAGVVIGQLDKVRFSRGVTGRIFLLAAVCIGGLVSLGLVGVLTRIADWNLLLIVVVATAVLGIVGITGIFVFGLKQPGAALLDGVELIRYQTAELASKSGPIPMPGPIVTARSVLQIQDKSDPS